jgi:hypothetical protein
VSRTTRVRGPGGAGFQSQVVVNHDLACLGKPAFKQTLGNWPAPAASDPLPSRGEGKKLVYDSSVTKWLDRMSFVHSTSFQQTLGSVAELPSRLGDSISKLLSTGK